MPAPDVVVLAAGLGTRLGRPFPKPLTPLTTGETILGRQISCLRAVFGVDVRILVVVGFKMDLIIEAHPDVVYGYNEVFDSTNTAKSLLRGLRLTGPSDVLWMNGDVVFDERALALARDHMAAKLSFVCVNDAKVGDEEVKYALDDAGHIEQLSKHVPSPRGEAVGINYVTASDKQALIQRLEECADGDYFEQAIEWLVHKDHVSVLPVDISAYECVEVDFAEDLAKANAFLTSAGAP